MRNRKTKAAHYNRAAFETRVEHWAERLEAEQKAEHDLGLVVMRRVLANLPEHVVNPREYVVVLEGQIYRSLYEGFENGSISAKRALGLIACELRQVNDMAAMAAWGKGYLSGVARARQEFHDILGDVRNDFRSTIEPWKARDWQLADVTVPVLTDMSPTAEEQALATPAYAPANELVIVR